MVQSAFRRLAGLFLTAVCTLTIVWGQGVTTATIVGKVTGAGGSPLTGATVVAKHEPSGTTYGAFSREDGRFTMPGLRVGGPYTVTVSFEGYKPATANNISLSLGQVFDLPVVLTETSSTVATVEINAENNSIMNGDRTGAATNIGQNSLRTLPTISRSLTDFTRLTPQSNGNNFGGRNNLYNNVMIDGSSFNNSFGLASNIGGQTNSQPISLDAIEEIQVSLAPYDVRQSGFTGAGVNAVTRSGDNKVRASVFAFARNEAMIGKRVDTFQLTNNNFSQYQTGFRVGGPIIKDKVFFFLNAEVERRSDPATTIRAFRDGDDSSDPSISNVTASDMEGLANFLKTTYNYDPGQFENYNFLTQSNKILAKVDWNINQKHKFSIRYNYFTSSRDIPVSNSGAAGANRQASKNTLPFQAASYIQNNNMNSVVAELNSVISSKLSNNAILGLTMLRDFRESKGDVFPLVDILYNGNTMTSFGYEPFTPNNRLNTDNIQFTDNLTYYAAKNHTVTAGINVEHFRFANGFTPRYYGDFRFNSLADFYNAAPAGTETPIGISTGAGRPIRYELTYNSAKELDGVSTMIIQTGNYTDTVPVAKINVTQIGLYLQDEWAVSNKLKVTIGARADVPYYPIDLPVNDSMASLTFANGTKVDPSQLPSAKVLWSPRVGFNWDVLGNKTLQARGGTGIFTGRIPFVWLSNQASNNGVLFGSIIATGSASAPLSAYPFSADPRTYIPANASAPASVLINSTSANFRFPQVWRSNLAVDYKLPMGVIASLEGIFTKDLNAVYHRDMNMLEAQGHAVAVGTGSDTRERFPASYNNNSTAYNRRNQYVTNAIELANTNQGHSYFVTASLSKEPAKTDLGTFFGSMAYTYGRTKDLTSSPSSIAATAWNSNQVPSNPNTPVLSWSNYDLTSRFFASLSYEKEFGKVLTITGSLFYNIQRAGSLQSGAAQVTAPDTRFSYTYSGDMNGDGIASNDLVYVPRDQSEIILQDLYFNATTKSLTTSASGNTLVYTKEQQWADLETYINQDDYMSNNRGSIMARNGAMMPWRSTVDLRLMIDPHKTFGADKQGFQVTLDILNLGNMINPKWGVLQTPNRVSLINFESYNANGQPQYTYRPQSISTTTASNNVTTFNGYTPLTSTFVKNTGIASRWQMQVGIRYLFN